MEVDRCLLFVFSWRFFWPASLVQDEILFVCVCTNHRGFSQKCLGMYACVRCLVASSVQLQLCNCVRVLRWCDEKKNKGSMQGRIAFSDHSVFILKMWKLKDKLILCDFLFFMCCCFQKKNDKTFFKTSPVFIWKCESSKINRSLCNSFFLYDCSCVVVFREKKDEKLFTRSKQLS